MSSMDCNTTFLPSAKYTAGVHGKNPPFVVLHPISRKKTEKVTDFSKKIFDHKHKNDICHFYYRNTSVKNIISYITATNGKMLCASLLIKDFAEYIGLTITELKTNETLKILFETMPPKWQYINCVYKLYIENNGFYLTDEQRKYVYEIYLKERNN